jgi:perosamine synthetase
MKNIPWSKPLLNIEDKKFLNNAFRSTWISDGEYVSKLQTIVKKKIKRKFAYTASSGTAAIHLAYLALDLKSNEEIVVPAYGYMACANIAELMELKVKFCEVDINTYCVTLNSIKKSVTKKTKAVVVTNTYGNMGEIYKISKFLKKKKIFLIEDAAESLGSLTYNTASGKFGDVSTLSFQSTKNITTGEGGMVLTDNSKIAKKIKLYRSHGIHKERYKHLVFGHNFRLSNLLASIGYSQFKRTKKINERKIHLYKQYLKYLNLNGINLQNFSINQKSIPWTFSLTLKNSFKTKKLTLFLRKNKIETRRGFFSPSRLKLYKVKKNLFPVSDYLSENVICLPLFLGLNEKEIKFICSKINLFMKNK